MSIICLVLPLVQQRKICKIIKRVANMLCILQSYHVIFLL